MEDMLIKNMDNKERNGGMVLEFDLFRGVNSIIVEE